MMYKKKRHSLFQVLLNGKPIFSSEIYQEAQKFCYGYEGGYTDTLRIEKHYVRADAMEQMKAVSRALEEEKKCQKKDQMQIQ